jgi:hypothetical protein
MSATVTLARTLPRALTLRDTPDDIAALWAMSAQERVDAMWAGALTLSQLTKWSSRRPHEVPLLGGEFAWIVMRMPEWDESAVGRRDNVVHLPERRRGDRAAA